MRVEDFRSVCVGSDLHQQHPVGRSPFVLASTCCTPPVAMLVFFSNVAVSVSRRYPPNVVLQMKTVAMRADVRQSDPSHSVDWRDDPPQEVRAFLRISCAMPKRPISSIATFS